MARTDKVVFAVEDGRVVVTPYYAQFYVGQEIRFEAAPGTPWALEFHGKRSPEGPGGATVAHGNGARMWPRLVARRTGHFGYSVALTGPDSRLEYTVFMDAACPEIIIDAQEE
ncbi:MAG: hypothetical protein ACE15B_05260 [Bryobacteraceae bacterium]